MTAPIAATDRNLLFGILALQLDFLSRDQLIAAMHAWVLAKARPLGSILVEQGALGSNEQALLDALVNTHLERHGNDPERSLAALASAGLAQDDLVQVADSEVQASLARAWATRAPTDWPDATPGTLAAEGEEPNTTRPASVGLSTSTGQRFRILRPHAKGGLGQVSVALDEELHREVALKEIQERHADDPDSRARFLLEAKITGGLEHPGIVPVYGLGHYPDGRPFYAMRLIRGDCLKVAIERFHRADVPGRDPGQRILELRQLLGRFIDVCNAVAYAHSRGVLHRDLKPANIMLGKYGETLVLDWGLAKPVKDKEKSTAAEEPTLHPLSAVPLAETVTGAALGTPAYMSPEQAAGRPALLGPGSDVYNLGATLYHLLTGRAPFIDADVGVVVQKVQRSEFPLPREVNRLVPPALEAICLKAMAPRPQDRYPSPRCLADDLEHWLADEPVAAYCDPPRARLARWGRRHKLLVTGAAVLLVTAVAGLAAGLVLLGRKQAEVVEERNTARKARDQAQAIRLFYEDYVLAAARPKGWGAGRGVTLKEALDRAAPNIGRSFVGQPELEAAVRNTLGMTYWWLGQYQAAGPHLDRAYALRLEVLGPDHPDTLLSLHNLSRQHWRQGKFGEAAAKCREVLRRRRRVLGPAHEDTLWSQINLGLFLSLQGRLDEAETMLRQGIGACKRTLGPDHHHSLWGQANLAWLLGHKGELAEAEELYRRTWEAQRRALGREHTNTLKTQSNLARVLGQRGKLGEAERLFRQTLDVQRREVGLKYPNTLLTQDGLANVLGDQGKLDEAEKLCRGTVEARRSVSGPDHPETLRSQLTLARVLGKRGQSGECEKLIREVLTAQRKALGPDHLDLASTLSDFGRHLTDNGRLAEAERLLREGLAIREKQLASNSWLIAGARSLLGACLVRQSKFAEAEPLLVDACKGLPGANDAPAKRVAWAFDQIVGLYEAWGKPEQAEVWRKKRPPAAE